MKTPNPRSAAVFALFTALVAAAVFFSHPDSPTFQEAPRAAVSPSPAASTATAPAAPTALPVAPSQVLPTSEPGTAIPLFMPPGQPIGTKVDPRAPAYRQVSTGSKPSGRAAVVSRDGFAALAGVNSGDTVSLPLMDGKVALGTVDVVRRDRGWTRVGGELKDGNGRFALSSNGVYAGGLIMLKREKLVYELTEQKDGKLWMLEKARADVVCDPLPAPPGPELAPRAGPVEAVPILNSRPGAANVIYLDFDGEVVSDTLWGNITAASYNLSAAVITEIHNRVTEDWYPFNINVTTDEANYTNAAVGHRMRVIITPTTTAAPGAGGVAYLTSFRNAGTGSFDPDIPCWVFTPDRKYCAEATSHEVGHTMGLNHDGRTSPVEEYYLGHGSGATGWCPIMGAGYYKNTVQWSKGEYTAADNHEDDLAIISASYNHFGYMPDDAGNTLASANGLSGNPTTGVIDQVGLIERTGDIDYYTFFTNGGPTTINAADPSTSPNLDIVLELQDSTGTTIGAVSNPPAALNASVSANLTQGQYFVKVSPTGAPAPPATGYTSYASIGQYVLSGTVTGLTQNPIITSAATANGQVGASFGYRIKATGNPATFGATGTLPPGTALDTDTGYIVGYPTQAGVFAVTVSATNASGTGTRNVTITIADAALTLGEAVDFPSLTYTTTAAPWLGQKTVFYQPPGPPLTDGDAAQAAVIGDGEESSFSTSVETKDGPTALVFNWKVASELNGDFLILKIDGVEVNSISGAPAAWATVSVPLDENPHVISWIYRKNGAFADAPDSAWVDNVTFNSANAPTVDSEADASGEVGVAFSYQITATNIPWSFAVASGTLPLGLTLDPASGVISGVPAVATNTIVSVTATNNIGVSVAFPIAFSIDPSSISIAEALDDGTAGAFTTAAVPVGAAKWFPETAVTHDTEDAMQSGPIGPGEQTSITKTVSGINTVNFWWKVEAKPTGNFVRFLVDGTEKARLSGISDWENISVFVGPGSHTLVWSFARDASGSLGADAAWLDEVTLTTALLPVIQGVDPLIVNGTEGTAFSYQIMASNSPTSYSATDLPGGLTVNSSGLISGVPTANGNFAVTLEATNAAGTGTKNIHILLAPAPITLAQAVENATVPQLLWSTDTDHPWQAQTAFSYDTKHAGQSGAVPQGGKSAIETHVNGPITVSFQWTVDSELNKDFLRFYIDGVFQNQISGQMSPVGGPANWQQRTYTLGSGDHTLRWIYSKDPSTSVGRDAAWLDDVILVSGSAVPVITSPLTATAYVGRPFTYEITATNLPTSFAATPLPADLTLNSGTGLMAGIPRAAGQTPIYISGTNANGPGGQEVLLLTVAAEPPGADNFANATSLSGAVISVEGTNAFATAETGEPAHAGRPAKASIWYSWTAPLSGLVNVSTALSAVDTLLSVYQGTALNNLVVVAENDDAGKGVSSAVKFKAVSGQTYLFAVDTLNGMPGKIVLNVMYAATGVYSGLLKDPNGVEAPGLATISLTPKFSFSGGIYFGAKKIGLKGDFTGEDYVGVVPRSKGLTPLQVSLHLDLSPGAEEITGKVITDKGTPNEVTYNLFAKLALKEVDPVEFNFPKLPKKNASDPFEATRYASSMSFTFVIEPNDVATAGLPHGTGYGSATLDKSGKVKTTVVLGDGARFTTGTTVATDKSWLLVVNNKAGGGAAGEVLLDAGGFFPPLSALLDWKRGADAKAKFFKPGFGPTTATLKGYRYAKPEKDHTMFLTTTANSLNFAFPLGDLAPPPTGFTATLDTKHKLNGGPAGLKTKFDAKSGLFSGSFLDSTSTEHDFGGALLQTAPIQGAGLFFGTATTGGVTVTPSP